MKENGFRLNVMGDWKTLFDAVRSYDWGSKDKTTGDIYRENLIGSRQRMFDDDADSEVTCGVDLDGLDHLAELLKRWLPVAREVSLWAVGKNDEASFEIGLVFNGKHDIVMPICASRLKDKAGKLAEAAMEAKRILEEAAK